MEMMPMLAALLPPCFTSTHGLCLRLFPGMTMNTPTKDFESRIEERFRLYVDESGDHVFTHLEEASHRFLCLLGCWIRIRDYRLFHGQLEAFKQRHFPHNPDDPLVLHREDILNRRGSFWRLRDKQATDSFDGELLELIEQTYFRMCAVVIDKKALRERYPVPSHPYHLAMGFLLQRYCGFLNHISRFGDVMAESRGSREDHHLKDSYERVFQRGVWMNRAEFFQRCLTTKELKLKQKSANVAGLQLADLLAHPVKQSILIEKGLVAGPLSTFAEKLQAVFEKKYNRQLYLGETWGYGKVLFPS